MTSDSAVPLPVSTDAPAPAQPEVSVNLQIRLKIDDGRLLLILPTEAETPAKSSWNDFIEQLKHRLSAGDRFWQPGTDVHLHAFDRLLDGRQLQAIANTLSENHLHLKLVCTSRRQTAVTAAGAGYSVEQVPPFSSLNKNPDQSSQRLADTLYLQTTIRSGVEIRHPGTVVILGEVNPGGIVVAAGDILVWGRLRGFAHAGAFGNSECLIMALQMEPTQLRIADYVARSPETPPAQFYPEVAYVTPEGIRIALAADFAKNTSLLAGLANSMS